MPHFYVSRRAVLVMVRVRATGKYSHVAVGHMAVFRVTLTLARTETDLLGT